MSTPNGSRRRSRPAQIWWSLTAAAMVLGVGSLFLGDAGAQEEKGSTTSVVIDRVDASGDSVVADGTIIGAGADDLRLRSGDEQLDASVTTVGIGLANDVVAVIDTTETLGNGTVQLAKQSVTALLPDEGPSTSLGLITVGGAASVQVGSSTSPDEIRTALEGIDPAGQSAATFDGLSRAAALLEDRAPNSVGTVVLLTAAADLSDPAAISRARADLQRAGVRLDVVALPRGTAIAPLQEMVDSLGGTMRQVRSDEDFDRAMGQVEAGLEGRFRASFAPPSDDDLVTVTAQVGKATSSVTYSDGVVRTGTDGLAPVAPADGGGILTSSIVKYLIVAMGLTAAMMLVWSIAALVLPDRENLTRRLEVYDESYGAEVYDDGLDDSAVSVPILKKAVEFTGEMAERRGVLHKVEVMLERANLPLRAAEAMFFAAVAVSILVVLAFFATGNLIVAGIVALVGAMLPSAILNFKIRSRQKAFVAQLPDTLTLLAGTLKAGYSIGQGFESISGEVEDPMGRELRRVVTETRLGRSLEEALEAVAERMDSEDFGWAVMAIRIQREVGGNLAELLLTVADTMTQRERLRREVSTLTAEGKMSAIIIGLLPPGLAGVMFVMNPTYIGELFSPGLGYALLAGAVVMMIIGFAWMKKTITIEV